MCEQEQVAEGGTEVGSVQVGVLGRPRMVGLLAARTKHLQERRISVLREWKKSDEA